MKKKRRILQGWSFKKERKKKKKPNEGLLRKGKFLSIGELWNADSDAAIEEGEKIRVLKTDGLKLKVEKLKWRGEEWEKERP